MGGLLLGRGSIKLKLIDGLPGSFEAALTDTANAFLNKSFYGVKPYVGINLVILPWFSIRVGGSYLLVLGDKWTMGEQSFDGPLEQVKAPVLQISGIFGGKREGK